MRCQAQAAEPPRLSRPGDRLPPARAGGERAAPQDPMPAGIPEDLREDFLRRVRLLPSTTVLHIPVSQRERHSAVVAGLLNRMADGHAAACTLEEARSRLLLGPVPRGLNSCVELARRLQTLSDGCDEFCLATLFFFKDLLSLLVVCIII